jgi:NTE family protein
VRQDGISALLWSGLNPVGLARLSAPNRERIDLLIDYLDQQLFREKTFADLWQTADRPYLILNAGDMVEGTPFSFTQSTFNLLCSDLSKLKLSTAVAASAAFPVALSPVTLVDYSPCEAQRSTEWPPLWVENAANSDWYDNPVRVMRGRVARTYALGSTAGKAYVHLMDGGIADNLGESEPLRLLTSADVSPNYFTQISQGRIKRLIWIIINARSDPPSKLDTNGATPGIADMFQGTVNSAIDSRTSSGIYELNESLREQWAAAAGEMPPELAANFRTIANNTFLVGVDFEAIPDPACRKAFQSIPTSWTLSPTQIDALMLIGPALLTAAPDFRRAATALGAHGDSSPATITQACSKLASGDAARSSQP